MRVNRQIRAPKVRLIDHNGSQVGVISIQEAQRKAEEAGLDLVEVSPNANPPVCKVIDYGKFRYDQTKREKESKKSQHVIKVKEVKVRPNIDKHDMQTKMRHARDFLEKGNKVKFTCMFRGREMAHTEFGEKLMQEIIDAMEDCATVETPPKRFGRILSMVMAPGAKKKVKKESPPRGDETLGEKSA